MSNLSSVVENPDLNLHGFNFAKQTSGKKTLAITKFRLGKSFFKIKIDGTVTTNGINANEFGEGKNKKTVYSLGFAPESETDLELLSTLSEKVAAYVPEDERDDWEVCDIVKEDKIYFKLALTGDKKSFQVASNIPINPKKYQDANIKSNQEVAVTFDVSAYFNVPGKKCGLVLTPFRFTFVTDDDDATEVQTPPSKKLKSN